MLRHICVTSRFENDTHKTLNRSLKSMKVLTLKNLNLTNEKLFIKISFLKVSNLLCSNEFICAISLWGSFKSNLGFNSLRVFILPSEKGSDKILYFMFGNAKVIAAFCGLSERQQ